ncbi:HupE/UreJ family protein [Kineosporia sp. J2-2]|uniref:HupE/UreJ family protein n=1 Tax=Kineosporia corallincola TaxID=2835133 RepID=A0ABS5T9R4_9ACTN|nr:HupE/UreJ family protein [Kineosporia corallincola]MBT0767588.1 HupE/UreJ family protein [Kineosporia corallincola]
MFRRTLRGLALVAVVAGVVLGAAPALAHGFTSVVYADVTSSGKDRLSTELGLEYDLLVVSAADSAQDDALFSDGTAAFESGDPAAQAAALDRHAEPVLAYVADRFTVSGCEAPRAGGFTVAEREGVPYAFVTLEQACAGDGYELTSTLFPDSEGFVRDTRTIVSYAVGGLHGSAALDASDPTFDLSQNGIARFWEFFKLGAEHLLGGPDHILFLLALIAGSRRLREVVLVATSFTLAHSVTLVLAALGLVSVPAAVVEPIIALSIAVVAGWYLYRLWQRGSEVGDIQGAEGHFSLDRAGWTRLGVVFCFGLVHGLGFAGALGIDEAWSWTLLWSLLVFNVGIEAVQLGLIVVLFPVLVLLRRRAPRVGITVSGVVSAAVSAVGLFWFFERIL